MNHEGLVYINTQQNYYARWSRKTKTRTHAFQTDEPLTQYWVEMLRVNPEIIDKEAK